MNVLVTGGAGYIGSIVSEQLIAQGHKVVVYDDIRHGHLSALSPAATLVRADLADYTLLRETLRGHRIDCVVHMAAYIEAGESVCNPAKYYHNNVGNTLVLLDAMVAEGVGKLVYSSSAGVYGDPERVPITEDARLRPTNPYGQSKLMVERALEWYDKECGLRYASLRYFNAAGATATLGEVHRPETHLIPIVLHVALGQRPSVSIFGTDYDTPDGTCVRDYIHVSDLAAAHVLAVGALDRGSAVYNLGNGSGFSVREVIATARRITGHPIPAIEAPRRPGDPAMLVASSVKIIADLGGAPSYLDLESIIASAWRWHQSHPHGYAE